MISMGGMDSECSNGVPGLGLRILKGMQSIPSCLREKASSNRC
jgi:hypothetical protein